MPEPTQPNQSPSDAGSGPDNRSSATAQRDPRDARDSRNYSRMGDDMPRGDPRYYGQGARYYGAPPGGEADYTDYTEYRRDRDRDRDRDRERRGRDRDRDEWDWMDRHYNYRRWREYPDSMFFEMSGERFPAWLLALVRLLHEREYHDNPGHKHRDNPGHNPGSNPGHNPGHYYGNSSKEYAMGSDKVEVENNFRFPHGWGGFDGYGRGGCGGGEGGLASALPLLLAGRADRGDSFGFGGGGGLGALVLLALLGGNGFCGRDRGHGHGGDRDCDDVAITAALSNIAAAIPQTALQTQGTITNGLAQLALGTQQGFSNVKDSVQASTFALSTQLSNINQNVSDQGCDTRATVLAAQNAIISKIDGNRISELETQLARLHNHDHVRDSEIRMTQVVNQTQAQAQQQQQQQQFAVELNRLFGLFGGIANQIQVNRQAQDIVNLGTMTASGTQAAANTQVR